MAYLFNRWLNHSDGYSEIYEYIVTKCRVSVNKCEWRDPSCFIVPCSHHRDDKQNEQGTHSPKFDHCHVDVTSNLNVGTEYRYKPDGILMKKMEFTTLSLYVEVSLLSFR